MVERLYYQYSNTTIGQGHIETGRVLIRSNLIENQRHCRPIIHIWLRPFPRAIQQQN